MYKSLDSHALVVFCHHKCTCFFLPVSVAWTHLLPSLGSSYPALDLVAPLGNIRLIGAPTDTLELNY